MGIFDAYLADIKKEVQRATDGAKKIQSGTQKIVSIIDDVEDKITHLPTEKQLKEKVRRKIKNTTEVATKKISPEKKTG